MSKHVGTRDLAKRLTRSNPRGVPSRHQAVVTATDAGPPATVTIELDGGSQALSGVRYLGWYAPTIGDTVEVLIDGTDIIVLGTLA